MISYPEASIDPKAFPRSIRFWETAHLPLTFANINTYFSLRAKCWLRGLRGGVGRQLPRNA